MASSKALLVGIGGGSGSGKSTVAKRLREALGSELATIVELDSFYLDNESGSNRDRAAINFDHPEAIDWDLLIDVLHHLRDGEPVEVPAYDFSAHARRDEAVEIEPVPIVLLEGIHCLVHEPLRRLLDLTIFVDTPADVRFIRRLRRDILDRDRSIDSVINQYLETVRPMHDLYVAPSRTVADIVIPEGTGQNEMGVELMVDALAERLRSRLQTETSSY